jgi:hypothetical protein
MNKLTYEQLCTLVDYQKEEYDRLESAWQDAELRAEKAEARVKELEDTVTGLEAALNSLGQS